MSRPKVVPGPTPPADTDAELSVLGGIMIDPAATGHERLKPSDFYDPRHKLIFGACQALRDRNEPVDALTVKAELESIGYLGDAGGMAYLADITESCPCAANVAHYSEIVRRLARAREYQGAVRNALAELGEKGADAEALRDRFIDNLLSLGEQASAYKPMSAAELAKAHIKLLEARQSGQRDGIRMGIAPLDKILGGMQPGQLIVLAARPAMGKTAMATAIASHAVLHEAERALVFSLEMSCEQLGDRLISERSGIELTRLRAGRFSNHDWDYINQACQALFTDRMAIVDRPALSISEIRGLARQWAGRMKIGLVVIDYMQLVAGTGDNREQEVASVARGCKQLARELKCTVLALSQLNRGVESRQNKRPMLSDLRESGGIEQDSDVVMFLYRDDYYNENSDVPGEVEVNVAKQRMGPTGVVKIRWNGPCARFET